MHYKFGLLVAVVALPFSAANAQADGYDGFAACGAYYLALDAIRPDWAPDVPTLAGRYALLEKAAIASDSHSNAKDIKTEMSEGGTFLATMATHALESKRTMFKAQWSKCSEMHVVAKRFLQE